MPIFADGHGAALKKIAARSRQFIIHCNINLL
jgi:hypothetical protein